MCVQLCMRDNAAQSSVPTALVLPLPDPVVGVTAGAWHTVRKCVCSNSICASRLSTYLMESRSCCTEIEGLTRDLLRDLWTWKVTYEI